MNLISTEFLFACWETIDTLRGGAKVALPVAPWAGAGAAVGAGVEGDKEDVGFLDV